MNVDHIELERAHLPNGVELFHEVGGEGERLVFIHGVMGDWRSWDAQWDDFRRDYQCLRYSRRYNFPNHNTMESPHHSAVLEAEDLRLLLDHVGWDSATLVGSSYGAFVALALATLHPSRCRALALSEPPMMRYAGRSAAGAAAEQQFRERVMEPANAAFRAGDDELGARLMTGGINGSSAPTLSAEAMVRRLQNVKAMKTLALSSDEFPWIEPEALAALSMPVLLMSGGHTPPIHAEIFRNVCAAMPQAQVERIPDAGHGTSRDNPTVFNHTVRRFLQERVHG